MSRKAFCQACSNEKHGVKTRRAVEHTCGKQYKDGLTLKPGPYRNDADTALIKKAEAIMTSIMSLLPGERLLIDDRAFFLYWEYDYNPNKGETARGELKKWVDGLYKEKNISAFYETGSDIDQRIEFKNELTTQLDQFMFLLQQFQQQYGYAAKPFGYLAHPKDAWALRLQIMSVYPQGKEPLKLDGISVIESNDIEQGRPLFVRK